MTGRVQKANSNNEIAPIMAILRRAGYKGKEFASGLQQLSNKTCVVVQRLSFTEIQNADKRFTVQHSISHKRASNSADSAGKDDVKKRRMAEIQRISSEKQLRGRPRGRPPLRNRPSGLCLGRPPVEKSPAPSSRTSAQVVKDDAQLNLGSSSISNDLGNEPTSKSVESKFGPSPSSGSDVAVKQVNPHTGFYGNATQREESVESSTSSSERLSSDSGPRPAVNDEVHHVTRPAPVHIKPTVRTRECVVLPVAVYEPTRSETPFESFSSDKCSSRQYLHKGKSENASFKELIKFSSGHPYLPSALEGKRPCVGEGQRDSQPPNCLGLPKNQQIEPSKDLKLLLENIPPPVAECFEYVAQLLILCLKNLAMFDRRMEEAQSLRVPDDLLQLIEEEKNGSMLKMFEKIASKYEILHDYFEKSVFQALEWKVKLMYPHSFHDVFMRVVKDFTYYRCVDHCSNKKQKTEVEESSKLSSVETSEISSDKTNEISSDKRREISSDKTREISFDKTSELSSDETSELSSDKTSELSSDKATESPDKTSESSSDKANEHICGKASDPPDKTCEQSFVKTCKPSIKKTSELSSDITNVTPDEANESSSDKTSEPSSGKTCELSFDKAIESSDKASEPSSVKGSGSSVKGSESSDKSSVPSSDKGSESSSHKGSESSSDKTREPSSYEAGEPCDQASGPFPDKANERCEETHEPANKTDESSTSVEERSTQRENNLLEKQESVGLDESKYVEKVIQTKETESGFDIESLDIIFADSSNECEKQLRKEVQVEEFSHPEKGLQDKAAFDSGKEVPADSCWSPKKSSLPEDDNSYFLPQLGTSLEKEAVFHDQPEVSISSPCKPQLPLPASTLQKVGLATQAQPQAEVTFHPQKQPEIHIPKDHIQNSSFPQNRELQFIMQPQSHPQNGGVSLIRFIPRSQVPTVYSVGNQGQVNSQDFAQIQVGSNSQPLVLQSQPNPQPIVVQQQTSPQPILLQSQTNPHPIVFQSQSNLQPIVIQPPTNPQPIAIQQSPNSQSAVFFQPQNQGPSARFALQPQVTGSLPNALPCDDATSDGDSPDDSPDGDFPDGVHSDSVPSDGFFSDVISPAHLPMNINSPNALPPNVLPPSVLSPNVLPLNGLPNLPNVHHPNGLLPNVHPANVLLPSQNLPQINCQGLVQNNGEPVSQRVQILPGIPPEQPTTMVLAGSQVPIPMRTQDQNNGLYFTPLLTLISPKENIEAHMRVCAQLQGQVQREQIREQQ